MYSAIQNTMLEKSKHEPCVNYRIKQNINGALINLDREPALGCLNHLIVITFIFRDTFESLKHGMK